MVIQGFSGHGIVLRSSSNVLEANYVGVTLSGGGANGNGGSGIYVDNVGGNRIGGASAGSKQSALRKWRRPP